MYIKLTGFVALMLLAIMITPAYAVVTSMSLEKGFYTTDENFKLIGTQDGKETIFIIIRDMSGNFKGMLSDPSPDQGEFTAIPRPVSNFFNSEGIYNVTAFVDNQKEEEGFTIKLEFDNDKLFEVPEFILKLNTITDKIVEVEKTVSFTASISDSSISDVVFSLENEPTGATIDVDSGKFIWTPSKSQGNIQDVFYTFDIIVNKGSQEDREEITITVKQAYVEPEPEQKLPEPEPEPITEPQELQIPASFVDETKDPQSYVNRYNNEASYKEWFDENHSEYDSIYQAVGLEEPLQIPASFVDETKDPQSYVNRYNNEASYKEWFDENHSEYDSIYQAVGLEEPKVLAAFVDPNIDPQYYIDRYNNEITYKDWFDETYPDITIYEAVGVEEQVIEEPEYGECGEGTDLVNGMCVIIENSEGGGCLIATAAYGSEMAPQVQFLREIRDNQLMSTNSGTAFMTGFNQFYYSFSPYVADMERENPVFKEAVKIAIIPLLSSLSVLSYAESESEVLGIGISVILMNLGMYFAAPIIIVFKARKYIKI